MNMQKDNTTLPKRAVIFDFGGVLMKTVDRQARYAWDDRLGLSRGSVERVVHGSASWRLAQTGALAVDAYWDDTGQQLGLDRDALERLKADYFSGDRLDDDLIDYIHELRAAGHRVALLSNDSIQLIDKLRALNIDGLFDPLVISAAIGVMKPDAAAYLAVLDGLACAPDQTIFIDDMLANVAAAQALGIHAVRYNTGMDLRAALTPLLTA